MVWNGYNLQLGTIKLIEFLPEYGLFLAKLVSIFIVVVFLLIIIFILVVKAKSESFEQLDIKHFNNKVDTLRSSINSLILDKKELKELSKQNKKEEKERKKQPESKKRMFVLNFKGDIRASDASNLADEITAIISILKSNDEVVVVLESGGGTVHGYGYAASQLLRIKDNGNHLTVAVDKVAASGGYMMACVADKIIAAPFAIIGSIGVLAQIPNFNKLLKKHNIDFEQVSAGKYKRTLTMFGENTDEDREKLQEELEETHILFKDFVKTNREQVDVEKIATGEHWYGKQALELNLVDELSTSEAYLMNAIDEYNVYLVENVKKKSFIEKLFSTVHAYFTPAV